MTPPGSSRQTHSLSQRNAGAARRALGPGRVRCRRRDAHYRCVARVNSYSRCQTAQSSSFPPRVVAPGFVQFVCFVGWVERSETHRQSRHTAPPLMGFAQERSTHPTTSSLSHLHVSISGSSPFFPFVSSASTSAPGEGG